MLNNITIGIKYYYLLLILTIVGCSEINEKKPISASEIILTSELLRYNDLNKKEILDMALDQCCCYPHNWNHGENCVDKKDAFYVRVTIDYNLLSLITESKANTRKDLLNKNPHFLYGKYRNKWRFVNESGNTMCETSKFEGHNSFSLVRQSSYDILIIGPLPEKPKEIYIDTWESKNYPELVPKSIVND